MAVGLGADAKAGGYVVIFKCPWRFAVSGSYIGTPESGTPPAPWAPVNGKKIGFDLQINECNVGGTRLGALVWNNTTGSNYQNCTNWGVAKLIGKPSP